MISHWGGQTPKTGLGALIVIITIIIFIVMIMIVIIITSPERGRMNSQRAQSTYKVCIIVIITMIVLHHAIQAIIVISRLTISVQYGMMASLYRLLASRSSSSPS